MRIHKTNTADYPVYSDYLNVDVLPSGYSTQWNFSEKETTVNSSVKEIINEFLTASLKSAGLPHLTSAFGTAVGKLISADKSALLIFDDSSGSFTSYEKQLFTDVEEFIDRHYKYGGLDDMFENYQAVEFNGTSVFNDFRNQAYAFIPLTDSRTLKAILFLANPEKNISQNHQKLQIIKILFNAFLLKAESINQKVLLKNLFFEIQSYQSKLNRDYRYSAIGEFTAGIIEEILSGLQIILSTADLGKSEVENENLSVIKEQVTRINGMLNNLARFASREESYTEKIPLSLASVIEEYCTFASPSLRTRNYEIILEQDENIPTILSSADQIKQILTSIFSLIVRGNSDRGGIFIHTRCLNNNIIVRFLSTDQIDENESDENNSINIKIIRKIMSFHNGNAEIRTKSLSGSSVTLIFPLLGESS